MRNHLGTSFKVWNRRRSWFWLVLNQQGNGGAIGTAATEAEAVRDACSSIEELAACPPSLSATSTAIESRGLVPALNQAYPCNAVFGWMDWWTSVAHQVTDKMLTRWADLVLRST
jgi:hypothetical protein